MESERPPETQRPAAPPAEEVSRPLQIAVRGATRESWRSRAETVGLTVTAVVTLGLGLTMVVSGTTVGAPFQDHVELGVVLLSIGLGLSIDLLAVGPLLHLLRRVGAEGARLRAALACPYCKDALPDAAAMACDTKGCGAFYHEECWAECHASYGGCAIYGCGGKTSHPVGRLALRRHVLRLVIAALLFTPKLVKRIQESEQLSFRDVWQRAREYQRGVSNDALRTVGFGLVNATVCVVLITLLEHAKYTERISDVMFAVLLLPSFALPILFMRTPLFAHFGWGVMRVLATVFRAELAALRRADEGTFLARLAGGLGKKA